MDGFAAKADLSAMRRQRAGDDGDERRFPRSVLSEQNVRFTGPQVEIDLVQRLDAGKLPGNPGEIEKRRVPVRKGPASRMPPFALHRQQSPARFSSR